MSRRCIQPASSQQLSLLAALRAAGWQMVARTTDLPWWADEVWTVESNWRPVGLRAFLTFTVDPLCYSASRRRGKNVWAVRCTRAWPEGAGQDAEIAYVALHHWDQRLVELMGCLSAFRDQAV